MSIIQTLKQDLGLLPQTVSAEERTLQRLDSSDGMPNVEASWHIHVEDLELGECLGAGNYGQVYAGSYLGTDVAVKRMDIEAMGRDNMTKYIKRELACSKYVVLHITIGILNQLFITDTATLTSWDLLE